MSDKERITYSYTCYAVEERYISSIEDKVNEILAENRGYELFDIKYSSQTVIDRSDNKSDLHRALIIFKIPETESQQNIPDF